MKSEITILDLFSGIGGFSLGLKRAGFNIKHHYFSEIDKHAIAVYKHNFKNSEYVGSVTDFRGGDLKHRPNIITFGSPCQDFSLAGKRSGMEGERSSLILHAIRLIRECRPDFFIWENVKGAFSSNSGADFWGILQAFANIGGYRLEWQLVNTAWVLPQNRERIYLIGHLAKPGRDFRQVFPFRESDMLNNKTQKQTQGKGERIWCYNTQANTISRRYHKDGSENLIKVYSAKEDEASIIDNSHKNEGVREYKNVSPTLNSRDYKEPRMVKNNNQIRRLTPIECERLQGFPDNWTATGNYDGEIKPMSDTQRYKQCGNAVTVDIVAMIATRLKEYYYAK